MHSLRRKIDTLLLYLAYSIICYYRSLRYTVRPYMHRAVGLRPIATLGTH